MNHAAHSLAPAEIEGRRVRAELLSAVDILNRWARGNGRQWAYQIYGAKNFVVRHAGGWRFRTSVQVKCQACGGSGIWTRGWDGGDHDYCWHCSNGKRLLQFLVSEIPINNNPFEVIQWHTPRDRVSWMTQEEFDRLQMVPPGVWTPNQEGQDLDEAAGLALLLQVQQVVLDWRREEV